MGACCSGKGNKEENAEIKAYDSIAISTPRVKNDKISTPQSNLVTVEQCQPINANQLNEAL
jgi:hypothetical protein